MSDTLVFIPAWNEEENLPAVLNDLRRELPEAEVQHPAAELARLLTLVREDRCDVAVGSRFVSGDGYAPYRYKPSLPRRFGTAVLRRAMGVALGRPFSDATS